MQTIIKLFFIAAVLFLGYTIATADGPLIVTTTDSQQPPAPTPAPAIIITATPIPMPTTAPTVFIEPPPVVIPNPPNPGEVLALTPETQTAVVNDGELEAVTAALETSQKVAAACLDAWVADSMAGRVPQNCAGILAQVQALTVKQYELLTEGR